MSRLTFAPPSEGWPELKKTEQVEETKQECYFESIECTFSGKCHNCKHRPVNLKIEKK